MTSDVAVYALLVFSTAFAGGLISLIKPWSDEWLHLFLSFGAGVFIGTVFLHLLPKTYTGSHGMVESLYVLIGFILIFFIEKFLSVKGDKSYAQGHLVTSIVAMLGLSVHSLIEGFALVAGAHQKEVGSFLVISVIAHKVPAAFSLTSLFVLAKLSKRKAIGLLLIFSLMTPLGALLFSPLLGDGDGFLISAATALTAGTFLYISVGELLPEVFHSSQHKWFKLALMLLGIIIMGVFGHSFESGQSH